MNSLRIGLLLLVCGLGAGLSQAQDVGVTAAVNQSAQGDRPGAGIRTIALGDNVIYNERIDTDGAGLVQILLVDGTTFTVGPNSSLTIDSFVYDPNAGSAQVAATLGKGVLRFIGGATSKTEDGVAITTPVGTVGIRGGVTDISLLQNQSVPIHIDMIFGNEVTLFSGSDLLGRLYQAGYSLAIGANGIDTVKTPPEWSNQIQSALTGPPGSDGGAPNSPTDETVAESGVPDSNSENTLADNTPPNPLPRLVRDDEVEDTVLDTATDDTLRDEVVDAVPELTELMGFSAAMFHVSADIPSFGLVRGYVPLTTGLGFSPTGGDLSFADVTVNENGKPTEAVIDLLPGCPDCGISVAIDKDGAAIIINPGVSGAEVVFEGEGTLESHADVTLPAGVDYCTCAFLDWGFWSFSADLEFGGANVQVGVDHGTWVAADITTEQQLDGLGVGELAGTMATYNGHAIGTVVTGDIFDPSATSHLAAGDMNLQWSFAHRQGEVAITDFDGKDFGGTITMPDGNVFTGVLTGDAAGQTVGAFVNDGTTPAAGVMGDFLVLDGTDWMATGVYLGER